MGKADLLHPLESRSLDIEKWPLVLHLSSPIPKTIGPEKEFSVRCVRIGNMKRNGKMGVQTILPVAFLLAVPGWIWLVYLVTQTSPKVGNRWMFFAAVVLAVTGTSAPLVAMVNRVVRPAPARYFETVLREAVMIGVFSASLLWLNKGQVLSFGLAVILGGGFLLVEVLLRLRSGSIWLPGESDLDEPDSSPKA